VDPPDRPSGAAPTARPADRPARHHRRSLCPAAQPPGVGGAGRLQIRAGEYRSPRDSIRGRPKRFRSSEPLRAADIAGRSEDRDRDPDPRADHCCGLAGAEPAPTDRPREPGLSRTDQATVTCSHVSPSGSTRGSSYPCLPLPRRPQAPADLDFCGALGENRTPNLLIRSPAGPVRQGRSPPWTTL
jgi:hypothetical protein